MKVVSINSSKVIIKSKIPFHQKILSLCLPENYIDRDVYEFRTSSIAMQKIRLILIAGVIVDL